MRSVGPACAGPAQHPPVSAFRRQGVSACSCPSVGRIAVKKVNRYVPDVPQRVADRGTEIVERHLAAYGVSRAMDLPEEGKVRLMREMNGFFGGELPEGLPLLDPSD